MSLYNLASSIKRDGLLLLKAPREFIYSFRDPSDQYVKIDPFDPQLFEIGKELLKNIQIQCPSLTIYFIGSAALKIAGERDIDFIGESSPEQFSKYVPGISKVLGKPVKTRPEFVEWITQKKGCNIELTLISPDHPIVKLPLKTNELLRTNKDLREKYEKVKLSSDGVSIREYKRRRLEFFTSLNKLIG